MHRVNFCRLCASVLLLASAAAARGASTTEPTSSSLAESLDTRPVLFPKGSFTFDAYASYAAGLDRDDRLASANIGFNYYLWNNVSLGVEFTGSREFIPGPDTHDAYGAGLSLVYRNHLFTWDRATFFSDIEFGPLQSTARIPSGGTDFNVAFRSGIGGTYQLDDHLHLLAGVRYFHISNAHLEGPRRNPSVNGIEGYFGVMWKF
jgi:hypothetical protein